MSDLRGEWKRQTGKALLGLTVAIASVTPPHAIIAELRDTVEIRIAGGKTIVATITAGGPVPAEDTRIKIEFAGLLVGAEPENSREPHLIWSFRVRNKRPQEPVAVTVDDVTFDPIVALVRDDNPSVRAGSWSGAARAIPLTKSALPWVFDSGSTMKVFRFTVRYADDQESVVHQLTMVPESAKETIRAQGNRIRSGR